MQHPFIENPWQRIKRNQFEAAKKAKNLGLLRPCNFCHSVDFPVKNVKISSMKQRPEEEEAEKEAKPKSISIANGLWK